MTEPLFQRLDDIANRTGIPQGYDAAALETGPRRRPMRWLPILSIALGVIGVTMALFGERLGEPVLILGFLPSVWMPLFGPVKPLGWTKTVDERDVQIRSAAYLATLPAVLISAIALLALVPWRISVALKGASDVDSFFLVVGMGTTAALFLLIVFNSMPTLYASLRWPPVQGDEEDD